MFFFECSKDAGSVACTGYCPEKGRGKNSESNRWRIQIDGQPSRSSSTIHQSSYQHIFHTGDFHQSSSQQHWKSYTRCWASFQSTKCLLGIDANTKLADHSDGSRVGYEVPHSDMTAGDEEMATFMVNFMAKNGLVAQNTWTAAAP